MAEPVFYPRFIEHRLAEALDDSPVVLIHGPRQCGKATLALLSCAPEYLNREIAGVTRAGRRIGPKWARKHQDYAYFSFDDPAVRGAARSDPLGFAADLPERVILDEMQRVPILFEAIKIEVDRHRVPGRFLLTGSTNLMLLPALSESLAGRMQIVRLHPLAQRELSAQHVPAPCAESSPEGCEFLTALFQDGFPVGRFERLGKQLAGLIVAGGFPPALRIPTDRRKHRWYRSYLETLIQRDVREMSNIQSRHILRNLLSAAASQTARLFNLARLASPFQLSRPTISNYVTLLERLFLLDLLSPWHRNFLRRMVKAPKLHLADSGLAAALLGADSRAVSDDRALLGQLLETFVLQELKRQAGWHQEPMEFFHFRDKDGVEVDIVIELGSRWVAGIEIKASSSVFPSDFRGLRKLSSAAGDRFARGVVLYDGETSVGFGDRLHAVPVRRLWET